METVWRSETLFACSDCFTKPAKRLVRQRLINFLSAQSTGGKITKSASAQSLNADTQKIRSVQRQQKLYLSPELVCTRICPFSRDIEMEAERVRGVAASRPCRTE